ncbi:MAG: DUF47 family protein [Candidatus Obscuribacterales bacterium]|nr:DUF47 family protein [Candidatus Obscuribacterales bacterium]
MEKKRRFFGFSSIFEPTVDFYALLTRQAEKTLEGVEALAVWLDENKEEQAQKIKDLEKEADVLKIDLERKLVESFVTPFDREDIFELSASLDEVINSAKAIAREVEAFDVSPQGTAVHDMAFLLVEGTVFLRNSIKNLRHDLKEASNQALLARKSENRFTKTYRQAIRDLLKLDDFKTIMRIKEVYKAMLAGAERIDTVGEKLLHTIVKMS